MCEDNALQPCLHAFELPNTEISFLPNSAGSAAAAQPCHSATRISYHYSTISGLIYNSLEVRLDVFVNRFQSCGKISSLPYLFILGVRLH